jgi:hypothetical protein
MMTGILSKGELFSLSDFLLPNQYEENEENTEKIINLILC